MYNKVVKVRFGPITINIVLPCIGIEIRVDVYEAIERVIVVHLAVSFCKSLPEDKPFDLNEIGHSKHWIRSVGNPYHRYWAIILCVSGSNYCLRD